MAHSSLMLLGITLDVPKDVHDFVRTIQKEFSDQFGVSKGMVQQPHITLKRPFEREDSSVFEDFLSSYVKTLKKFPVTLDGFGFFDEGVVFIKVAESSELKALKKGVSQHLEDYLNIPQDNLEKNGFIFHLTLAYGDVTPDILEEIKKIYEHKPVQFTFETPSLSLLRNSGGEWLPTKIYLIP